MQASPFAVGFDVDRPLSLSQARALKAEYDYSFCVRYVGKGKLQANDLSAAETEQILASGLGLMVMQQVGPQGWYPWELLGMRYGAMAAMNARAAGVPQGVAVFCDLDGVVESAVAADVWAFGNLWCAAVASAGFVPGIYVGADCGLDALGLSALDCRLFWRSCSGVPSPAQGYAMVQSAFAVERGEPGVRVDESRVGEKPGSLAWALGR